ncbi:hypothetical protein CF326_g8785 [Tilletia indica]|uniref:Uncharacterized protein n=1 Tax=Tilletia indica TaxID=43049 RepID=A0A177TRS0_9BASI|nr:hypothetical protein CF326_g8785 [Tilletia indica]KAE8251027.1 hypothetical protein A4X13_0g4195 [Tilletia indica]
MEKKMAIGGKLPEAPTDIRKTVHPDYPECRLLFKELLAEGLSVGRIVKEAGISIELAKKCAEDLGVSLVKAAPPKLTLSADATKPPALKVSSIVKPASPSIMSPIIPTASTSTSTIKKPLKAKPWRCPNFPRCEKVYTSKQGLEYHVESGTCLGNKASPEREKVSVYFCPYGCGKEYDKKASYDYHVKQGKCDAKPGSAAPAVEQKLYLCKMPGCSNRFETMTGLTHHLNTAHGAMGLELARAMGS